jgi:hypothetical protein
MRALRGVKNTNSLNQLFQTYPFAAYLTGSLQRDGAKPREFQQKIPDPGEYVAKG